MKIKESKSGFSLTELLVVIGIISVLVFIAAPIFISTIGVAEARTCKVNIHIINNVSLQYRHTTGSFPETIQEMVDSGLLKTLPYCPAGGNYDYDSSTGTASCDKHP